MDFWILLTVVSFIYLSTDFLIFLRSKHIQITRRSPWLMHLSLYGNLIELISISTLIPFLNQSPLKDSTLIFLRDCGSVLGHYMFFVPYILRAYRINLVFNLEHNWESSGAIFKTQINRTRQIWLLKFFALLMVLPLTLCIAIFFYNPLEKIFPITTNKKASMNSEYATGVYVFVCFLEQVLIIFMTNLIRNVDNQFDMKSELVSVCLLWSISPIFSTFVDIDRILWFIACAIRNLLVFLRSDLYCVFVSFRESSFEGALTIEMLNSMEIILENERALEYFERFLRNQPNFGEKDSGYALLGHYKELECRLHVRSFELSVTEVEMTSKYSVLNRLAKSSSPESIQQSKQLIQKILNEKHYNEFLLSEECGRLRKMIQKEEAITFRVTQTSFLPINVKKQKIDEWAME